jgi:hypothetical protein
VLNCSFCARSQDEVAKLVAGPGVYICDTCVDLCVTIIAKEKSEKSPGETPATRPSPNRLPEWSELSDDQMLDRLPRIAHAVAQVENGMDEWVGELRRRGVTWVRIGEKLSMTRQSAWERFKHSGTEDRPE